MYRRLTLAIRMHLAQFLEYPTTRIAKSKKIILKILLETLAAHSIMLCSVDLDYYLVK